MPRLLLRPVLFTVIIVFALLLQHSTALLRGSTGENDQDFKGHLHFFSSATAADSVFEGNTVFARFCSRLKELQRHIGSSQRLPLVLATPFEACAAPADSGAYKGRVVLARRGGCSFLDKAKRLAALGAKAVLIANHGDSIFTMEALAGVGDLAVGIPVGMVGATTSGKIRALLESSTSTPAVRLDFTGFDDRDTDEEDETKSDRHLHVLVEGQVSQTFGFAPGTFGKPVEAPVRLRVVHTELTNAYACTPLKAARPAALVAQGFNIAVVAKRGGGCSFVEKALVARAVGAAALLIVNDASDLTPAAAEPRVAIKAKKELEDVIVAMVPLVAGQALSLAALKGGSTENVDVLLHKDFGDQAFEAELAARDKKIKEAEEEERRRKAAEEERKRKAAAEAAARAAKLAARARKNGQARGDGGVKLIEDREQRSRSRVDGGDTEGEGEGKGGGEGGGGSSGGRWWWPSVVHQHGDPEPALLDNGYITLAWGSTSGTTSTTFVFTSLTLICIGIVCGLACGALLPALVGTPPSSLGDVPRSPPLSSTRMKTRRRKQEYWTRHWRKRLRKAVLELLSDHPSSSLGAKRSRFTSAIVAGGALLALCVSVLASQLRLVLAWLRGVGLAGWRKIFPFHRRLRRRVQLEHQQQQQKTKLHRHAQEGEEGVLRTSTTQTKTKKKDVAAAAGGTGAAAAAVVGVEDEVVGSALGSFQAIHHHQHSL